MEKKLIIKAEGISLTGEQWSELKYNINNVLNFLQKIDKDIKVEITGLVINYLKK